MRFRTTLSVGALLLPLAAASLALGPGESCREAGRTAADEAIELCTLETFLRCEDGDHQKTHLDNVHGAVQLVTDAPTRSVQAGAGCGRPSTPVADPGQLPAEEVLRVAGEYTGNLAEVAVELHVLGPGVGQLGEDIAVPLTLTIGDDVVVDEVVAAEVVPSSTNASVALRFSFDVDGLAAEAGPGATARTIELVAGTPSASAVGCGEAPNGGTGCAPAGGYAYVWGTEEVPAGIVFNPVS